MKRRTKQWNERGSTRIAFRGSLLLKIEETGGRRKASYKRQVKTRDVPAIYLCRRGPPARNLRHFLFFSSSPFPPSPFLFSSSFSSLSPRIFFFLFFFLLQFSRLQFFSFLISNAVSLSLSPSVSVRPLLRIYESSRLYKWTHCSFLGQRVARGSLLSFTKGVVFRCRAPPRKRDNRKWYIVSWRGCWNIFVGIEIRDIISIYRNLINNRFFRLLRDCVRAQDN